MISSQDEQTAKLQDELKKLLEQASSLTNNDLEQRFQILNTATRDLVAFYTDQIRNLGIISGVVAPFSLLVLQIDAINANVYFLLLGFIVLVVNIILSQTFLYKEFAKRNKKIINASVKYTFTFDNKRILDDERQEVGKRTDSLLNYSSNIREFDKLLGLTPYDTDGLYEKVKFKKNSKYMIIIFSIGCAFIVLSILANPVFYYVGEILQKINWQIL